MEGWQLTRPDSLNNEIERVYCAYCRGPMDISGIDWEQGYHTFCLKDVSEYKSELNAKLEIVKELEISLGRSIPEYMYSDWRKYYNRIYNGCLIQGRELTGLKLRGCKLSKFPESILAFDNLKYLDLSSNTLTEIPESIQSLKELKVLGLSKNKFEIFPEVITGLDLEDFRIGKNPFDFPADCIRYPETFRNLNRPIKHGLYVTPPPSIGKLTNLQILDLEGVKISTLPDEFANLQELQQINLAGNRFTEIPNILKWLPKLRLVKLNRNSRLRQ